MITRKWLIACICIITAISLVSCNKNSQSTGSTNTSSSSQSDTTSSSNATGGSTEGGVEKVKPAPGKGNVQGKVLYNGKPVENIEVKLCEQFSQYVSGCGGKNNTARTDNNGADVVVHVEAENYEGLGGPVFVTESRLFSADVVGR